MAKSATADLCPLGEGFWDLPSRVDAKLPQELYGRRGSQLPTPWSLEHKVICVAGGAGYLGSAVVGGLLAAGAHVFNIGSKAPPHKHSSLAWEIVDLSNPGEIAAALSAYPGLDGLVVLAGRGLRGKNQRPDDFVKTVKDTLGVQYNCVKGARPYLWNGSAVVLVGSVWGQYAPDFSLYLDLNNEPSAGTAAAFGGVRGMLHYLAVEMAPRTRVNCVVPGWFPKPSSTPREDYIDGLKKVIPMGRIGVPEDIVGPVLFLLSSMSAYMTGQELIVDGGYST